MSSTDNSTTADSMTANNTAASSAATGNSDRNPPNVQTLDYARHGKLKVRQDPGYAHAATSNIAAIILSELGDCASNFPLAILPDPEGGDPLKPHSMVALLGLTKGENVYHGQQFWSSTHVPFSVQRYPFVIGFDENATGDAPQLGPCVVVDSPLLNEKEGLALWNSEDQQSEFLQQRLRMLRLLWEGEQVTRRFLQRLHELNLLVKLDIELLQQRGGTRRVGGLLTIDETRLNVLDAAQLKALQEANFLAPCYLILTSLYQIKHMLRQRNRKGGEQIVNFRLLFNGEAPQGQAAQ